MIEAKRRKTAAQPATKTKVVGYVRVSTDEQATEGVSLDAQRAKLAMFADLHGLDLVAIECDAGVSQKSLDRPGLAKALARLESGEAAGLVIAKLDRLSRSVSDWNRLIEAYFGPIAGKELFSVADSINTATASGRMVLNVIMSIAQWEREAIGERTRDALAHLRSQGQRSGPIAYGQRLDPDGTTIRVNAGEVATIAEIRERHREGWSLRKIASDLTARGVSTKGGGPWRHSTVARILEHEHQGVET